MADSFRPPRVVATALDPKQSTRAPEGGVRRHLPPPPRFGAPAWIQTVRFLRDPFSLLADAQRQLGDIFSLKIHGFGNWVFLCSPALFRQMCHAPPEILVAGENNRKMLGFMLGNDATFTLDGEAHRQRHRLVFPYLNGRSTHQHIPAMREIALRALSSWPEGKPFSFLRHAHRISLGVMMRAMFEASGPARTEELTQIFDRFARKGLRSPLMMMPYLQRDFGPRSPWGRVLQMRRDVVAAFSAEIAWRAASRGEEPENAPDIVSALARTPQKDDRHLSEQSLLDEVINLLFAGHETTGTVISWMMETLHTNPEILKKARFELSEVLQGKPIEPHHLSELKYLEAVIQETMRYRPLAPMAGVRLVKKPLEIGGYLIPEGTLITQAFPNLARDPEIFAHPDRFDPDHFYKRKTKPFEWNPFGGGTRMCIGKGIAEVEMKVVLATLLQHAEYRLAQKSVRPVRSGFFFAPSQGLRILVTNRTPM